MSAPVDPLWDRLTDVQVRVEAEIERRGEGWTTLDGFFQQLLHDLEKCVERATHRAMSGPDIPAFWPPLVSPDDGNAVLLACRRCGEGLMRWTELHTDRSGITLRFVCSVCEQRTACVVEAHRARCAIAWEFPQ